jgi:adenylosuccinate lyase
MDADAISPLDGRYAERLAPLRACFSERALVGARMEVELRYLRLLHHRGLFPPLSAAEAERIEEALAGAGDDDYRSVKAIEATTRHDVKAVEIHLRGKLQLSHPQAIHFGLTSEDVTNLAWSRLFDRYLEEQQLPLLDRLLSKLVELAERWREVPFPSHTHGQPASPTTAGKELAVFAARLLRLRRQLAEFRFLGKLAGATGTYGAMLAAFPSHDWEGLAQALVEELGLAHNPVTTQVEDHDTWARWFDLTRGVNNVIIDLDRDMWAYISRDLYRQRKAPGQVGSSTMPHKVNPIQFENSEGNLELSNALLTLLSDKLCRSRMQRDLSDSTVQRNVGVALGHAHLAWLECLRGLDKVELDPVACARCLEAHPELLGEPIQTILKVEGVPDPYELLREHTQGRVVTREDLLEMVAGLDISEGARARIRALTVPGYVGLAAQLTDRVIASVREEIEA